MERLNNKGYQYLVNLFVPKFGTMTKYFGVEQIVICNNGNVYAIELVTFLAKGNEILGFSEL